MTEETIQKFELGHSQDQWNALENEAKSKGYNPDLLEKAGLIIKKEDRQYDRFRDRVIFPVHNATGKVIAFGARMLTNAKSRVAKLYACLTQTSHKKPLKSMIRVSQCRSQKNNRAAMLVPLFLSSRIT